MLGVLFVNPQLTPYSFTVHSRGNGNASRGNKDDKTERRCRDVARDNKKYEQR